MAHMPSSPSGATIDGRGRELLKSVWGRPGKPRRSQALRSRGRSLAFLILFVSVAVPLTASRNAALAEGDEAKPRRFVLHPMPAPSPVLKYQVLPDFVDRLPGNAAVDYGKVKSEQSTLFASQQVWDKVYKWLPAPLEELRGEGAREWTYRQFGTVYDNLHRGARRESCDWQLPIRVKGQDFYGILLPEVQESRQFARVVALRARAEIAEGRFDEAVQTLQVGYALGQNVAKGETLINSLVGLAICGIMADQVEQYVQQPNAPNLYWALTTLPRPIIDFRPALEAEMSAPYLSFPELQDVETADWSPERWQDVYSRLLAALQRWSGKKSTQTLDSMAITALALKHYPMAKQYLVEHGYSSEAVEAMPVPQVVILYTVKTYKELRDPIAAAFYLPFPESREANRVADEQLRRFLGEGHAIIPDAYNMLPAIGGVREAIARGDREVALLRVIEAIRIYGAAHEGRLPEKLADVTEVPVPVDPVTEKPFDYELRGDIAVLRGQPLPGSPLVVEIQFAK